MPQENETVVNHYISITINVSKLTLAKPNNFDSNLFCLPEDRNGLLYQKETLFLRILLNNPELSWKIKISDVIFLMPILPTFISLKPTKSTASYKQKSTMDERRNVRNRTHAK